VLVNFVNCGHMMFAIDVAYDFIAMVHSVHVKA